MIPIDTLLAKFKVYAALHDHSILSMRNYCNGCMLRGMGCWALKDRPDAHVRISSMGDGDARLSHISLTKAPWSNRIWCMAFLDKEYQQSNLKHLTMIKNINGEST